MTFKYDPFGRRIQKVFTQNSTSTTTNYLYDGDNAIETVDQNGNALSKFAQGQNIDEPLAESVSGATYDYEQDGLGSVTSLTNSTSALSLSFTYDSFGKVTAFSGSVSNPFRYTGRDFDSETGLYYYRARYFDPVTGRFLSEDPMRFESSQPNFYAYVADDPINLSDPTGLTWKSNWNYFWDWVHGGSPSDRLYGPDNQETEEMKKSPGAQNMRDQFYENGCKSGRTRYGTIRAYWDTMANPFTADWSSTSAEVGGFGGPSGVTNNGDGTATFYIYNVSGTHSFFLHLVPNVSSTNGPGSNIYQRFTWTESIDKTKCKCGR